jgi:hypothetical protein
VLVWFNQLLFASLLSVLLDVSLPPNGAIFSIHKKIDTSKGTTTQKDGFIAYQTPPILQRTDISLERAPSRALDHMDGPWMGSPE